MSRHRALLLFASLLAPLAFGAFARKPKFSVRFHVEAIGNAGGSFTLPARFVNPARQGTLESVPFVTEKDLVGIYPVLNMDGSFGCAFQFDFGGSLRLRTVSTDRRGASVVGFIATKGGTHQLIDLTIDKPITDGIIFIPRGISAGEIEMLKKLYPPIKSKAKPTPTGENVPAPGAPQPHPSGMRPMD